MFLGINIFWTLLRAHFNHRQTAWAKMGPSRAQNIFMPANIDSICSSLLTHLSIKTCVKALKIQLTFKKFPRASSKVELGGSATNVAAAVLFHHESIET